MPFVKNSIHKNHQHLSTNRRIFVGRSDELHFFIENILRPEEPTYNIISISGQAGVGKSTLLAQFIDEAGASDFKDYCFTAIVNERQTTAINMMEKFASQLGMESEFVKSLEWYNDALRKLKIERDTAQESEWRKTTTDVANSITKDIPVVGGILSKGTEIGIGYAFDEFHYHHLLKDAERLEDPIDDLTKAFVKELNRYTEIQVTPTSSRQRRRQRLILFFDTFEQSASTAAPWLLDYFLESNINSNIILVIAGRDPLEHSIPDDPKRWLPFYDDNTIYSIPLDRFTEEETRTYLDERGISDSTRITTILQLSQGLPLYLGLLTANPQVEIDPTADVVGNFLRWIPEKEKIKRKLALDTALLSRPFNQDDLEAFSYLSEDEDERKNIYRWLTSLPFVLNSLQERRYSYHNLVQELFSRYLYQNSQKEYYTTRKSLANYYQEILRNTSTEGTGKLYLPSEWLDLTLAFAYQLFLLPDEASHVEAIEQILEAYKNTHQIEAIARLLRNLSIEQQNNLANSDTRQISIWLIKYIEESPTSNQQELLSCINSLIEKINKHSSFPTVLLSELYRKRGSIYYSLREYNKALTDLNYSIVLNINNLEAIIDRGNIYYTTKQNIQALADFDKVVKLNTNRKIEHTTQDRRGATLVRMKDYDKAIDAFTKAIIADPGCTQSWRGLVHALMEQYPKNKIPELLKSIPLPSVDAVLACSNRSNLLRQIELYEEALVEINHAIILDPQRSETFRNRGNIYVSLEHFEDAIADFNQAISLTPNNIAAAIDRGLAYQRMHRYEDALNDFNQVIKFYTGNSNSTQRTESFGEYEMAYSINNRKKLYLTYYMAVFSRGMTLAYLNRYKEALNDLDSAIELEPKDADTYYERGRLHSVLKSYTEAINDFDYAIKLDFDFNHPAQKEKGKIFSSIGMHQKAVEAFIKSLTTVPACTHCWTLLAKTYQQLYPLIEVADVLRQTMNLGENYNAIACRAAAMQNIELYEDAISDFTTVIERNPENAQFLAHRGQCYLKLKNYKEALSDFDLVIMLDESMASKLSKQRETAFSKLRNYRS